MSESESSHDLHRLTALTWDASIPIQWKVAFPGENESGHFLVPKMIPAHLCSKPMFEQITQNPHGSGFGTDKFKGWFEYHSRFNKHSFTAVIPWSVPIGIVVDWLIALEFPYLISSKEKDLVAKLFQSDSALPLELMFVESRLPILESTPTEAIKQSSFLEVDKQFAHKLWVAALLGTVDEAVKLAPQIERSLRSWDPHTFFRGRRDMVKRAGDKASTALVALHVVKPVTETRQGPYSLNTTLRLVEVGTEKMSTFGHLLKDTVFKDYHKFTHEQCLSTEPLAPELGLVRVLGMNPPLYTPLQFLRDNLCCRDFALHVVVRPLENTCSSPQFSAQQHNNSNNNNNSNQKEIQQQQQQQQPSPITSFGNMADSQSNMLTSSMSVSGFQPSQQNQQLGENGDTNNNSLGLDSTPRTAQDTLLLNNMLAPKVAKMVLDESPQEGKLAAETKPGSDPNL